MIRLWVYGCWVLGISVSDFDGERREEFKSRHLGAIGLDR